MNVSFLRGFQQGSWNSPFWGGIKLDANVWLWEIFPIILYCLGECHIMTPCVNSIFELNTVTFGSAFGRPLTSCLLGKKARMLKKQTLFSNEIIYRVSLFFKHTMSLFIHPKKKPGRKKIQLDELKSLAKNPSPVIDLGKFHGDLFRRLGIPQMVVIGIGNPGKSPDHSGLGIIV